MFDSAISSEEFAIYMTLTLTDKQVSDGCIETEQRLNVCFLLEKKRGMF